MKKAIIAIVIAAIIVAGAVIGLKVLKKPATEKGIVTEEKVVKAEKSLAKKMEKRKAAVKGQYTIDDMVPSDCILYASIQDMKNTWDVIQGSNFWAQLTSLQIWAEADMDANIALLKDQFKANLGIDLTEDSIMGLLGQNVTIAVVSGPGAPMSPNVLVMADLDPSTDASNAFMILLDKFKENLTVETKDYNGIEISSVQNPAVPGPQFNYAFLGNVFILGVGIDDAVVKQAIDLGQGRDSKSISTNENYLKALKKLSVRGELKSIVFINIENIVDILKTFPMPAGADGAVVTQGIERTLGIISSIVAAVSVDDGLYLKLFFQKNLNAENKELLDAWDINPKACKSLEFIPENTLLLSISNSLNIGNIWNIWKTNLEAQSPDQAEAILSGIKEFEDEIGLSLENDIIPVIGEEISFVISDVALGGLFPFPQISIMVEVTNEGKAADVMAKLMDYVVKTSTPAGVSGEEEGEEVPGLISKGTENYNGKEITFLDVKLPYQALNPAYSIEKGFLVIASSKIGLQKMIDTAAGTSKSVTSDQAYKKTTSGFSKKLNQLAYINLERVLDIAIEITNWASSLQAAGSQEAGSTQAVLQQNVIPFLKCLKALRAVGVEAINHDDGVSETITIIVEDLEK